MASIVLEVKASFVITLGIDDSVTDIWTGAAIADRVAQQAVEMLRLEPQGCIDQVKLIEIRTGDDE